MNKNMRGSVPRRKGTLPEEVLKEHAKNRNEMFHKLARRKHEKAKPSGGENPKD